MRRPKSSKQTVVHLVRHAQTQTTGKILPGRSLGLHLSDVGKQQAERVALNLSATGIEFGAIYVSPMERTLETAEPIAKALGLEMIVEDGLIEADFGDWTGQPLAELSKNPLWEWVQTRPSAFRFPKGESFAELQNRIAETIHKLESRHLGGQFIAVSHADTIKAMLCNALGLHLDMFQRIDVAPASVSVVSLGRQPRVWAMSGGSAIPNPASISKPRTEKNPS